MELWQRIVDYTSQNAAYTRENQWNLNYLEVVGTSFEATEKIDEICKRIPKLRVETRTRYVKPRVESKLGVNFKYTPPKRTKSATKVRKNTVVSLKVVAPKEEEQISGRNCLCSCKVCDEVDKGNGSDDDVNLDTLLEMVKLSEDKNYHGNTVKNLVRSYPGNVSLEEDEAKKILMMLDSSNSDIQEAMLILIGRLSQVFVNARLFLMFCALDDLIYLMLLGVTDQIQTQAALCISKLTERESCSKLWKETMVISGIEALFDVLGSKDVTEELQNAVLEIICNITSNETMATKLLDFGLDNVVQLLQTKNGKEKRSVSSSRTQKLATRAISNIVSHNVSLVEQFLAKYDDAVEEIVEILQFGKCPQQQEAARFLATLTLFKPSIDPIISHHATQHLLWAMTCSHCRFVREFTSEAFKNITKLNDTDQLLNALDQFTISQVSKTDSLPNPDTTSNIAETLSKSTMKENTNKIISTVKNQIGCSSMEKIMVDVFAIITLSFQTDALHLSGGARTFESDLGTRRRRNDNGVNEKYLSSLKVLCNVLVAIEALLGLKDKDDAASMESRSVVNLKLASLFVQCGGLNFIDQLKFLSTRLQIVNQPSFHCIDPTTLPPKEFVSTLKNARAKLIFQESKRPATLQQFPEFGFHREEINFMIQSLSLLTVLAQATVPNFDPTLEDLKLFEYRRQVGRKRHISFRASALVVKSAMKFGKLSPQIGPIEEKPPVVRKRFSIRKRSRTNSAGSTNSGRSPGHVAVPPASPIEPGSSSNYELVNYVKQSILNTKVVSHLSCWITCGVYDVQINVLKVLRYLMHISTVPKQPTDSQASTTEPPVAWGLKRTVSHQSGQRAPVVNTAPKTKSKATYLGHLCTRHVVEFCSPYLLDLLVPQAKGGLGRMSLMVIKECVSNGESDSRIKLAKFGCFAQIINYIRGAENEPEIQSLGLIVIRSLVSSDQALKQLFSAHGGMSLVMALHEYKEGVVKEQAAFTLRALSNVSALVSRPKGPISHSKKRHKKSLSADDIWDHVAHKWEGQDKVSKLLKKFNVRY